MQRFTVDSIPANAHSREYIRAHGNAIRFAGFKYPGFICNQYPTAYNDSAYWDTACHGHSFSNFYTNHTANHHP